MSSLQQNFTEIIAECGDRAQAPTSGEGCLSGEGHGWGGRWWPLWARHRWWLCPWDEPCRVPRDQAQGLASSSHHRAAARGWEGSPCPQGPSVREPFRLRVAHIPRLEW